MRWSEQGAGNLARVICSKSNGDLDKYIAKVYDSAVPVRIIKEAETEILSAAEIQEVVGSDKYGGLINAAVPVFASVSDAIEDLLRKIINDCSI